MPEWPWFVTTGISAMALVICVLGYLRGRRKYPKVEVSFRNEGESASLGGRTHSVISVAIANKGSIVPTETIFQIALPFLPGSLSEPIGPARTIRPRFGTKEGQNWHPWKDGSTLGVTFVNHGAVNLEPHISVILCQIWVPVAWFGPQPKPQRYQCRYSVTATPAKPAEGILELHLYELAEGYS